VSKDISKEDTSPAPEVDAARMIIAFVGGSARHDG